jgi:hypothetical protein
VASNLNYNLIKSIFQSSLIIRSNLTKKKENIKFLKLQKIAIDIKQTLSRILLQLITLKEIINLNKQSYYTYRKQKNLRKFLSRTAQMPISVRPGPHAY